MITKKSFPCLPPSPPIASSLVFEVAYSHLLMLASRTVNTLFFWHIFSTTIKQQSLLWSPGIHSHVCLHPPTGSSLASTWFASNNTSGDSYHQFLDPTINIRGDPQKELNKGGRYTRKKDWKLCFHQLHQIKHKKNLQIFAPVPFIIQIKKDTLLHCWSTSAVLMNDGPIQQKINQTFERFNCMVNSVAHCEKIVCVCFWYDPFLVVLNVIRKICWFMLIDFSDAAKYHQIRNYSTSQVMMNLEMCIVTKYKPLWHHWVVQKWWRIWKCALYYHP